MKPELPKFPTMLRKMWSGIEVQQWIDENVAPLFEQTAKAVKVPSDEKLPDLFREALSWGRAYGWTISAQQWSEFRDDQVAQLLSRYGQPVSSADTRPDYSEMSRETLEQHASRLAQMLADDKPRQFYVRYALGSASTPSCICCGRTPESVAVQHVEIPAIVVCQKCHDAATKPAASAEPSGYAYRYRHINGGTVLRFNHGEEVNGSKPIEAVPFWFKPQPQQIPEGYKLVPIEPTEDMVVAGFESAPDEHFTPIDEWERFQSMSGCQQAAHKAKLCWEAMLQAAPEPKEKP